MPHLKITNHGPLITETDYWHSPLAERGLLWCSVNAGTIRVLLPPTAYSALADMRTAQYCVLTRGPWPEQHVADAIEIMWEDGSDSPFALHLTPESFDLLPAEPEAGREWILSVWVEKDGRPHKAMERVCHWRRAPRLPWMKPWRTM